MPTTSSSSPPLLSSPGSSTGTVSSFAFSTPSTSSCASPSIPLTDVPTTTTTTTTTTTSGSDNTSTSGSLVSGPKTLHKRAPPASNPCSNPSAPACLQLMQNAHSSPSSGTSSSTQSAPPLSNKLIKRDHSTLGTLHDPQTIPNKHQANKLRKPSHNRDSHKVSPSFNDSDEVEPDLVLLANDGPLPAGANSSPTRSVANSQAPFLPAIYQTTAVTEPPRRPEVVRQQSYSKRHASFDTPRTEVPLPFFSEPFPRELERHQQKRSGSEETAWPPPPTGQSRVPPTPIPIPTSATATAPSISQVPPLNRNNSAPTPPSSPCPATTNVQDLKEAESLRDRVEREREEMGAPWPSIVPSSTSPLSSEEDIGRRSTASLPLPGDHVGEPLHQLEVAPSTPRTFLTMSVLRPLSSITSAPAPASFTPPRPFSLPPPPPPAAPVISTPPTTLHPLLDIPASASSSASNTPPQVHASLSTQLSAPPAPPPPSTPAFATTFTSHPTTSTILNSPPPPPQLPTATTITTGPHGPHMTVQTTSTAYVLTAFLPGYQRDEITLSTRKRRVLHVVADPFISSRSGTGHFERRISFGYDADMARVRAEFNAGVLKIIVPRRPTVSAPAGYDPKLGLGGGQQGHVWGTLGQ